MPSWYFHLFALWLLASLCVLYVIATTDEEGPDEF